MAGSCPSFRQPPVGTPRHAGCHPQGSAPLPALPAGAGAEEGACLRPSVRFSGRCRRGHGHQSQPGSGGGMEVKLCLSLA